MLFPDVASGNGEKSYTVLREDELLGWVLRCPACLKAEKTR
jgi:hypothetical protein